MNKKSLLHIVAMLVITIVLTACGGKGIDRRLNYSGTATELGESYGKAMVDATQEQQNVLRERMLPVLATVVSLAENSNPATVEAFQAKKNAEEFDRISKMSAREIVVYYLEEEQRMLNNNIQGVEEFQSGSTLKVEDLSVTEISTDYNYVNGTLSLRNDSGSFDYNLGGCELALILEGKQIHNHKKSCAIKNGQNLHSKGGKETYKFQYLFDDKESFKTYNSLLQSGQKISWDFKPYQASIHANSGIKAYWIDASDSDLKNYKAELQKVIADLAVMKK